MLGEGQLVLLGLWCCLGGGGHPLGAAHLTAFQHQGLVHPALLARRTARKQHVVSEFGGNALCDLGAGNFQRKSSSCWTSSVSLTAC